MFGRHIAHRRITCEMKGRFMLETVRRGRVDHHVGADCGCHLFKPLRGTRIDWQLSSMRMTWECREHNSPGAKSLQRSAVRGQVGKVVVAQPVVRIKRLKSNCSLGSEHTRSATAACADNFSQSD
jgi:hypothetical protein